MTWVDRIYMNKYNTNTNTQSTSMNNRQRISIRGQLIRIRGRLAQANNQQDNRRLISADRHLRGKNRELMWREASERQWLWTTRGLRVLQMGLVGESSWPVHVMCHLYFTHHAPCLHKRPVASCADWLGAMLGRIWTETAGVGFMAPLFISITVSV